MYGINHLVYRTTSSDVELADLESRITEGIINHDDIQRQSRCSVAPRRRSSTAAPATTVPALRIVTCAEGAWAAGVRSIRRGTGCWLPNAPGGRRRQGRRRGPRNGPREGLPPTIWRILADVP